MKFSSRSWPPLPRAVPTGILAARELQQYTESLVQRDCDFRLKEAPDDKSKDEIIGLFQREFKSKKKECAVLIIRTKNDPEKWTFAGDDYAGRSQSYTVPIDDSNDEFSKELNKKEPINKSRIIELAMSSSSPDPTPIDCNQDRGIFSAF